MNSDLRPYPEYKDSGIPWLGEVPAHWACMPHRALFEEIKNQGHTDEPLLSVTIGKGIIRQTDLLSNSSKKDSSNLDKSKYKLVEPYDITYNKMRAWQGAIGISRYRGIVSPAYIVQRLREDHNPEFFHYLFRTPGFAKEAERWSYGITSDQWSLRPEHFKMIYSCVPPRPEQDLIVRYLRSFVNKVNAFIRNRRRLIEVLNEQKQAIINKAVTLGIDPNVRLKPSGVNWLGDVPSHWEVVPLKRILSYGPRNGISPPISNSSNATKSFSISAIHDGRVEILDEYIKYVEVINTKQASSYYLKPGDILLVRGNGNIKLVGKAGLVKDIQSKLTYPDIMMRIRVDSYCVPDYMVKLMVL